MKFPLTPQTHFTRANQMAARCSLKCLLLYFKRNRMKNIKVLLHFSVISFIFYLLLHASVRSDHISEGNNKYSLFLFTGFVLRRSGPDVVWSENLDQLQACSSRLLTPPHDSSQPLWFSSGSPPALLQPSSSPPGSIRGRHS